MKKTIPAVLAALVITTLLAGGMFALGSGSFLTSASAAPVVTVNTQTAGDQASQVEQLQALVAEYQARETQYQSQIKEAADRINAANGQIDLANQQIQQYQTLLTDLQNSGLITLGTDGTVTINQQQSFSPFGDDHHNGARP
jgi:peptidoglycan hydrolase CwlO-like protein